MAPDAYATGTALVALHQAASLPTDDLACRRGVQFLLGTQLLDGSLHVATNQARSPSVVWTGEHMVRC
jgi:hypothetical protein